MNIQQERKCNTADNVSIGAPSKQSELKSLGLKTNMNRNKADSSNKPHLVQFSNVSKADILSQSWCIVDSLTTNITKNIELMITRKI